MIRMGFDMTCLLSNYPHASPLNTVMRDYLSGIMITRDWPRSQRRMVMDSEAYKVFSPYSQEDEENRRDMVLLGPFDEHGHPASHLLANKNPADAVRQGLIRVVTHVVPLDNDGAAASLGTFVSTASGLRYDTYRDPWLVFVNASALRILALAAPELTPQRLWAMQMESYSVRGVPGVDYGPIYQGGSFLQLHRVDDNPAFDQWVAALLHAGAAPTAHDRHLLMMGTGNMWVFVRPTAFPVADAFALRRASPLVRIADARATAPDSDAPPAAARAAPTLETLPADVLLLTCAHLPLAATASLCTASRTLLRALLPFLDALAHRRMDAEPWHLPPPAGPECAWFAEQCKLEGAGGAEAPFPWFWYARACRASASMRNRKRIWGIAGQLLGVARELGVLEI